MKSPQRIVIIGGGFGGVYAYRELRKKNSKKDIVITLISKSNYFLFTPLLHEVATGGLPVSSIIQPIRKFIHRNDTFCLTTATKVNTKEKTIETTLGSVSYDILILATGSETNFFNTPGAKERAYAVKDITSARKLKKDLYSNIERASELLCPEIVTKNNTADIDKLVSIVVIGGGATGVEVATEIADLVRRTLPAYYDKELIAKISVSLVHSQNNVVGQFPEKVRAESLRSLSRNNVHLHLGRRANEITADGVTLDNGEVIPSAMVIWTAGVKSILLDTDLPWPEEKGRIVVDTSLRVQGYSDIFALGDVAYADPEQKGQPLPTLAQVATKQAKYIARAVHCVIQGRMPSRFSYKQSGVLLSLGRWHAAGQVGPFFIRGRIAWWLWRTVYLSKLISFSKKVQVAVAWTIDIFLPRDISQI
jgi:NADH dehydrogenase